MIALLCAGTMALVGVVLVYAGWARANGVATCAGWATMFSSLPLWTQAAGPDRGVALAALTVMLGACVVIGATAERRERRAPTRDGDGARHAATSAADYRRAIAFALSAGPLAAAAAAALVFAFSNVAALDEVDRLLTVALLTPLLWGVLAVAALYAEHPWRGAAALAVALALGFFVA